MSGQSADSAPVAGAASRLVYPITCMHPVPLSPRRRDRAVSAVLTTVERAVDVVRGPRPPVLPTPRRVVVLKGCCLGDALLATPLLAALRRAYPRAHLVAGVGRWARPALL